MSAPFQGLCRGDGRELVVCGVLEHLLVVTHLWWVGGYDGFLVLLSCLWLVASVCRREKKGLSRCIVHHRPLLRFGWPCGQADMPRYDG